MEYIDLGLPSGTLWADTNKRGFLTFDEAVEKFGDSLPTIEQWKELQEYCAWRWDDKRKGRIVTGSNGNSIFLPAMGYREGQLVRYDAGFFGYYWSSSTYMDIPYSAWYIYFYSDNVYRNGGIRYDGLSVRLIKAK